MPTKPNRKHVKSARRRRNPIKAAARLSGLRNHGDGMSESAMRNRKDRLARLTQRKAA